MMPRGMRAAAGRLGRSCRQRRPFPLETIEINMNEIELIKLQDEVLSYLRDNITKDEKRLRS